MDAQPLHFSEQDRQRRIDQLHLFTAEAEPVFELLVALAALVSDEPVAMISLIDHDREWSKSSVGMPAGWAGPREGAPCACAMASSGWFEVDDLRQDEQFKHASIVQGAPFAVHYAAAPLEMPAGERIGCLSVQGPKPRRLNPHVREAMVLLARVTVQVMLLREQQMQLHDEAQQGLHFRTIANTIPHMLWTAQPDGRIDYFNDRWYEFMGVPPQPASVEAWEAHVHPDDLAGVQATWAHCVQTGTPCGAEMRKIHHSGEYRWVLARALPVRDEQGVVVRWVGTLTDIEDQKRAEAALRATDRRKDEFLAMLAHELRSPLAPIATVAHTLALVKSIVELHGGTVSASSEGPGRGSSFRIALSALESAPPPRAAMPQRIAGPAQRSLHVMVVEDNADAARFLGDWLKAQGHEVVVETDPLDALLQADNQPADVYVVDIGLPRMNGYQLARRLRANPRSREALLVALTGYGQAQDVSRAREAGFDYHMVKPMDPARLSHVLSQAHPLT